MTFPGVPDQIGRYQILSELGRGAMGHVYLALDPNIERRVALKVLLPLLKVGRREEAELRQRFLIEARAAGRLQHPGVVGVFDADTDPECGLSYIAMEWVDGTSLDELIRESGKLSILRTVEIAERVAIALGVAHEAGLVHRDIKPANILLDAMGCAKVTDFGIAKLASMSITATGWIPGSPYYMSPEQVRGEDLDFRSDIFSLGAVLYHVMTGALPFPGESFPEVCMAILDGRPRRPSEVRQGFPKALEDYLLRCMQPDSSERFHNGTEAHGALVAVADSLTGTSTSRPTALRGVVVLPDVTCGGENPESCHVMAGGVRRDLATELARNKGLTVHLQSPEELEAGTRYDYLVRTNLSVEEHRGSLKISVEFIDRTSNGRRTTRTTEDEVVQEDDDEWTLQEDLVRGAMRILRRRLSEVPVDPTPGSTRDVAQAKALTQRALDVLRKGTTKHLLAATSSLRRALDADRYCAEAYAGLAEALVRKSLTWDGDPTFMDEARENASRALALDTQCAVAHTALGFASQLSGNFENARREYRLAMQLDNHEWMAHRMLGGVYAREGNFKAASPLLQRAIVLQPNHIASYDHLYSVLQRLGRYEQALEFADAGIAAARERIARVKDDLDARVHMAMLYARLGDEKKARKTIQVARELAPKDAYTSFHAGCVYALLGEPTEALACLKYAQDRGYYMKSELVRNTDLDILRGLPEFQELNG